MTEIRSTGPETANAYRQQGQEASQQLGAGKSQVETQLVTAKQQTSIAMRQVADGGSQALGNLNSQLVSQLTSLEQSLQNQLQTQVAQKKQDIASAGQKAIATFEQQGQQAIAAGDGEVQEFTNQVADQEVDEAKAPEVAGEVVNRINGAYENLSATADGGLQQVQGSLDQAGVEVITAINSMSSTVTSQVQSFLGQAQGQIAQQTTTISGQLGSSVEQADTASSEMVDQAGIGLDEQINQLGQNFGQGVGEYQSGLDEQVTSVQEQAREPVQTLNSRTDQAQERAAERAEKSWLENQLNDLWNMLKDPSFWAGLVVGLLAGAFVIATFGTGAAVLVAAGAVAGALGALASTGVSNYREGKRGRDIFDGALRNMIWGAFGGAAGAAAMVFLGGGFIAGGSIGGLAGGLGLSTGGTIALLTGGASITAGVITVLDNVDSGRPWDQGLLGNMLLAGVFTLLGSKLSRNKSTTGKTQNSKNNKSTTNKTQNNNNKTPRNKSQGKKSQNTKQQRMATGAKEGLDPTPDTIGEGTVRMEQHPEYSRIIAEVERLGFKIEDANGDPHVTVREVVDPKGNFIRLEKILYARKGMRYLDLEHELGHIKQLSERFGDKPLPTERVIERPDGSLKESKVSDGVLSKWQDTITEYHNRLVEFIRLHERGVSPELLKEHAQGVAEWRASYITKGLKNRRSSTRQKWVNEHFPDIPDLENKYRQTGGYELEK